MAKDIEKLIEEFVIPEMEYSPDYEKKTRGKNKIKTVTIDEIPEVILQKTKAEVYNEAKGRLKQKSSAVSRRTKKSENEEVAATKPAPKKRADIAQQDAVISLAERPVWVGGADELVPFAWRMPLIPDINKPSKYYRQVVRSSKESLLPVPHDK
ncbi:MAG: hypothetical protein J1F69_00395 [Clostridiales bacterium]|nr:hypothetical protein [Clostridiales bacterium]